jgi:flagellar hook-length control protein FliK
MNSNAADVNVSALLNLGARPRVDKTVSEPSERKDSFERHLSEQVSRADNGQKRAVESKEKAASSDASESASDGASDSDLTSADAGQQTATPQKESNDDDRSSGAREGNTDEGAAEEVSLAANDSQSPADNLPESVEASGVLTLVPDKALLVNNTAQTDDLLIDVPVQASISLENLVAAVASGADEQSSAGEAVDAALNHLADAIEPIEAQAAAAGAQVAAQPVSAQTVPAPVITMAARAGEKTLVVEAELDVDPVELERIATTIDAKAGAAKTFDLVQSSNPVVEPSRQTLNQQMASALTAGVVSAGAKDQQSKFDLSSSAKEPAALVAVSQRVAARPVSVQQGSAQFSMPGQAKPGQPQWQTAVAERVAIMATQRITSAEIQLDPPELGQLQVRVTLNQDQASVSFASQHAVVREALDQTAHRLRDMFDSEGLNLVDVDVSDQSFQQQREDAQANSLGGDTTGDDEPIDEPVVTTISQGLVDHFV